jgi:hypothetical protein
MGAEVTNAIAPAAEEDRAREKGQRVFAGLFGPAPRLLSVIALAGSAIMPPDGIGFSLCVFQRMTGLPCPGCGLTRSVACITHLKPGAAWAYHPFGFVAYALLLVVFASNLLGAARRERLLRWFEGHGEGANFACWAIVLALLAFGVARLAVEWRTRGGAAV